MKSASLNRFALAAILVLAAAGFFMDVHMSLRVADWVWYFVPLLLTAFVGWRFSPFILAAFFTGLMLAAYYISPPAIQPHLALISRFTGSCVLWLIAMVLFLHRRTQSALQESKAYYRSMFENMLEGFAHCRMIYDGGKPQDFVYLAVNRAFENITGLKNVVGKRVTEVIPGIKEAHPELFEAYGRVASTGRPEKFEFNLETSQVWLDISVYSPAKDCFVAVFEDITGRKRAEEKIREQAALLEKARDAIFVLDLDGRIIYWNAGAERVFGWTAAEAIGKNSVDLLFRGILTPQLQESMKTTKERGEWVGELAEFTKDGKSIIVQGRANIICDEQDRPKSMLIIDTDITEKKKLEEQLLRAQRMESLGALAGGIAHDLNNVLTPILISVQVLKEKVTGDDGQKILDGLETYVLRGAKLVKQVLTFGRGILGERVPVQPALIVREIGEIIHETFPKSVKFEFQPANESWTVTGDPTQLHQVLLNLCLNARDAMPDGGRLSIRLENVVLDGDYAGMHVESKPGPHVVIKVSDTGTGISKETQERMFEPFFTTKKHGHGTGLGLSTSLGIVKSHGGFINCYSEMGKGSLFKVCLPANTQPVATGNVAPAQSPLPCGHGELVLVVDDEEPIREVAQKMLERFGYRVLTAVHGAEAVSIYKSRQNEIAAVVTDMAMPVMDGPAAIGALKSINPKVKIISSSGLASDVDMKKIINAGINHFIPKPYTTEALLQMLDRVLNDGSAK